MVCLSARNESIRTDSDCVLERNGWDGIVSWLGLVRNELICLSARNESIRADSDCFGLFLGRVGMDRDRFGRCLGLVGTRLD